MNHTSNKEKPPVAVTPDELAALDDGIESEKSRPVYTLDEAVEFARKRRKQWTRAQDTADAA